MRGWGQGKRTGRGRGETSLTAGPAPEQSAGSPSMLEAAFCSFAGALGSSLGAALAEAGFRVAKRFPVRFPDRKEPATGQG